jgi:hypothetical protein
MDLPPKEKCLEELNHDKHLTMYLEELGWLQAQALSD